MKTRLLTLSTLTVITVITGAALAAPQSFNFKDPKGVNNAQFKLDAPLEPISGSASGISGTVQFDPANPGATKGTIVVATDSLTCPNSMMKEHLHSGQWLDVAQHKEITFEAKELKNVKTTGEKTSADAVGTLTLKGVSRDITAPVTLTYLKDKLGQRVQNMKGDLLVIRSTFTIKRGDYGINPGAPKDKVAEDVEITLSVAGASPAR